MAQPSECRILFFCFVLLLMGCTSGVRNTVQQDSEARDQAYVTGYGTGTVNDEKNGEVENSHKENPSYIARYGGAKKTNQPYKISYGKEKRKSQPYITGYRGDKEINQPYITVYQIEKGMPLVVAGYGEKKEINQPYITGYRGAKKRKQPIIASDGDAKETNHPYITGYRGQGETNQPYITGHRGQGETNQPYITGHRGQGETNQPYITGYRSAKETKQLYITSYGDDIEKNKPYMASYWLGAQEKTNKPYIIAYRGSKETKQPYVTSYGDAKVTNQPYITAYGDAKKTNQPYIIAYGDAKETKQPYITSYGDTKKPDQPYIIAYGDAEKSNKHPYITQYHGNDKETSTNPKSKCTGHLHAGHNHMTGLENHMQTQPSTGVDHTEAFKIGFFTPDDLYLGKIMPLYFPIKDHSSRFLPREVADSIPFSMSQLPSLLQLFSVPQGSPEAKDMERTLQDCEHEPINGEIKSCATSLESMVEFARSIIGSEVNFKLLSTTHPTMAIDLAQNYTVSEAPKQVLAPKMVFCHPVPYPYAVFFCHFFGTETKVFQVTLHSESGDDVAAMAICHTDTSDWDPDHVLFSLLGVKPGTSSPVCHFLPKNHLVWIPSPTIATE